MKKKKYFIRVEVLVISSLLLFFIGCYHFSFVNQPHTAEPDSYFVSEISCNIDPGSGGDFYTPYFGVLVPFGWTVNDSIVYSFNSSIGWFIYSDTLTQQMYGISPVPLGYNWWVFEGSGEIQALTGFPFLFNPVINTDDQQGMFSLDYMIGDNSQGLNHDRSNGHLITVGLPKNITVTNSDDSGPGSLRAAIDGIDFYGSVNFDLDDGDTVFLEEEINIYKDISIIGPENYTVVISGQNENRVFYIDEYRNVQLANLHVIHGKADIGGGIYCIRYSSTLLQNITLANNTAVNYGGGITIDYNATVEFDSIEKCNVYLNNALWGNDIYTRNTIYNTTLIADTFTVLHPSEYHVFPFESFDYQILNEKIEQVDGELFVSPDGENTNSGTIAGEPLKTIDFAFSKIRADSLHQNTIHLLNGTYNSSINEDLFPIIIPEFINISGESTSSVILDAEEQSCAIYIDQNSSNDISNLTIMNGYNDSKGGGIYCKESDPVLRKLLVSNNNSNDGGGIRFYKSNPVLENVTVSYNTAVWGGGISAESSSLTFDSINRCNIYLNKATNGSEIHTHSAIDVFVDTFSVLHPTAYHTDPVDLVTYDILNGKLQQVDGDLFVSPDGDDDNSGITEDDPLKTISHASARIWVDNIHKNSIRLLEGTYGPSTNGEVMPAILHDNFKLSGISASKTILDAEDSTGVLFIDDGVIISDLTITGGNSDYGGGISCDAGADVTMRNLIISGNHADHGGGIHFGGFMGGVQATLQNVLISDNTALDQGGGISGGSLTLTLQNVTISNNTGGRGGGIHLAGGSTVFLQNSIISNNIGSEIFFLSFNPSNSATIAWSNVNGYIATNDNGTVNWHEGSIKEDPLFVEEGEYPYALSNNSPCIDAGNPDTLGLNLPEYDLAGGPRIFNDRLDMGAFEWNTIVGVEESDIQSSKYVFNCYPNPFSTSTTLVYELQQPTTVQITIYNYLGEQVEVIRQTQSAGKQQVLWIAEGLPAGIYFCVLKTNEGTKTMKMIKMK